MNYEDSVYYFVVIIFLIIFSSILITAFIFEIKEEYSAYYFVKEPPQSIIPGKDYCETFIIENHYNKDLFYHYTIDMFIERTLYVSYGKDVVYSEEKDLGDTLKGIKEVMKKTVYHYKILVVNDGSKDHTIKVAEEQGAMVVSHRRNKGLAETFRTEMKECLQRKADIIIHTDADGQYDPAQIPLLIKKVQEGYEKIL